MSPEEKKSLHEGVCVEKVLLKKKYTLKNPLVHGSMKFILLHKGRYMQSITHTGYI